MNQTNQSSNKYFNDSTNTASGKPKFLPPQKRFQQDQTDQGTENQPKVVEKTFTNENKNESQREFKSFTQQKTYNAPKSNFNPNSNYKSRDFHPQQHYGQHHGFHNQGSYSHHHQSHSVDPTTSHHHTRDENQSSRFSGSFFGRQITSFKLSKDSFLEIAPVLSQTGGIDT